MLPHGPVTIWVIYWWNYDRLEKTECTDSWRSSALHCWACFCIFMCFCLLFIMHNSYPRAKPMNPKMKNWPRGDRLLPFCIINTRAHSLQTYHVTLGGVDTISQAFDSDPFHRHLWDPPLPVVVSVVDLLGESKVCHTYIHVLIQPGDKKTKHDSGLFMVKGHSGSGGKVKNKKYKRIFIHLEVGCEVLQCLKYLNVLSN